MSFIVPENWKPANNMVLEEAAYQSVKHEGNLSVAAGPGAGKTELLAQKAGFLLETGICKPPHKILAISFKVDAAKNLEDRVINRYGKSLAKRFESRTFDSFAKSLVDQFLFSLPTDYRPSSDYDLILRPQDLTNIIKENLTESNPYFPNWYYEFTPSVFQKKLVEELPKEVQEDDLYSWLVHRSWDLLIKGKSNLNSSLTFPMISLLADCLLNNNPMLIRAIRATYTHVFLDEFQDTTKLQYTLLKTLFEGSRNYITAVGDEKQRIMGWAGALPDAFGTFKTDFTSKEKRLVKNFRSAPKLVQIQNVLSQNLSPNNVNVEVSGEWDSMDGFCEIWNYENHIKEATSVARAINNWINIDNLEPRDFCIIVKQQEHIYCKQLMLSLEELNISSRLEKEFQDLLSEECVELMINFLKLSLPGSKPKVWLDTIDFISTVRGGEEKSNYDALYNLEQRTSEFVDRLSGELERIKIQNNLEEDIHSLLQNIISFVGSNRLKAYFPKYRKSRYLDEIVKDTANKLWQSLSKQRDWELAIRDFLGDFSVPIMTIHKSKGLEYNTVIFLGLEDGAFWSFGSQTESDKKAFFVALSRAKERVIFTFSKAREVLHYRELKYLPQGHQNISQLYDLLSEAGVPTVNFD
ncbi:DNA helicase [Halobacillus halophilus]|uniref:DNA 3'-5' helicase n=1 Tax=Halobacillus halophilus (strain ATCC 35676 / DSM 2266 / JCM 20832 / KCTC 3685 / LMG 17431 / NBRC 102448 / NCIMB 2269) TaxID=866895 RepID=I0JSA3_HALH3|nr:ATP-dependent helicase [Halobacillus halophilus]ASF40962.1 DNA helicase [Halobacillus halophilus]CCG47024.1 UvrD/REP helicase family protein [Halobacillus halophilus DSM 2266]